MIQWFRSQMFKGVPSVSLDVKNERWDTTLKLVLNPQGFDYVMKDGIVVIRCNCNNGFCPGRPYSYG